MRKRIVFLLFLLSSGACAQDLMKDMGHFLTALEKAETVQYKAQIRIEYPDAAAQLQELEYMRTADALYYKTPQMELMASRTVSVMVYPQNRVVMWSETETRQMETIDMKAFRPDSLFNRPDSIVYKGVSAGMHTYLVYNHRHPVQRSEFVFRDSDRMLVRAVYYYSPEGGSGISRSEVTFTDFYLNKEMAPVKSWTSVLQTADKGYALRAAYSGYRLLPLTTLD